MANKEVLFTVAQDKTYNNTNRAAQLSSLQQKGFDEFYDQHFLEAEIQRLDESTSIDDLYFSWYPQNPPGEWLSQNIKTESHVVVEPITLERVQQELAQNPHVSHLVIATYLNGYSTFRNIAQWVRAEHPHIKIVAAAVGALVPETKALSDHQLVGNQVKELRRLLSEPEQDPLKVVTVPSATEASYGGITKKGQYALLISSLGCMYGCDFCPVTAATGTDYQAPFTAEEIIYGLIQAKEQVAPNSNIFTVSLAEPQGLGNIKLWREVLRLGKDLPFQVDLVTTTSSKVISKYRLDELTLGSIRLSTVNIGVESLLHGYAKNDRVDLRALNRWLQEAGIAVVSTYIVGFDWQTPENVREEVKLLAELGSSGYIVANLEMQPNTPLANSYRQQGRILNVPPELLSYYGYQPFTHPHFAAGFSDMLPLLDEVESTLAKGTNVLNSNLTIFMNRGNAAQQAQRVRTQRILDDLGNSLVPNAYPAGANRVMEKLRADIYFHTIFRNMDLFHPYILSTV